MNILDRFMLATLALIFGSTISYFTKELEYVGIISFILGLLYPEIKSITMWFIKIFDDGD